MLTHTCIHNLHTSSQTLTHAHMHTHTNTPGCMRATTRVHAVVHTHFHSHTHNAHTLMHVHTHTAVLRPCRAGLPRDVAQRPLGHSSPITPGGSLVSPEVPLRIPFWGHTLSPQGESPPAVALPSRFSIPSPPASFHRVSSCFHSEWQPPGGPTLTPLLRPLPYRARSPDQPRCQGGSDLGRGSVHSTSQDTAHRALAHAAWSAKSS